jgi:hypothetical protein
VHAWEMTMIQLSRHDPCLGNDKSSNHPEISNAVMQQSDTCYGVTHPRVILAWHGWFWVWPGGFTIIYIPLVWPWVSRHMDMHDAALSCLFSLHENDSDIFPMIFPFIFPMIFPVLNFLCILLCIRTKFSIITHHLSAGDHGASQWFTPLNLYCLLVCTSKWCMCI